MAVLPVDYQDVAAPTGILTELPATTVRGLNAINTQINTNTTAIAGKQDTDADLTAIAALAPTNDDVLQRKTGAWTNRTMAQLKTDLAVAADIAAAQTVTINPQTADYTLALTDANKAVEANKATAMNVVVPPNATVAFAIGAVVEVVQVGAGQVTVVAGSGVTINTPSSLRTRTQWSTLVLRKRATNTWLLAGDTE